MTSAQRTLVEVAAGVLVLAGTYLGWRAHERSIGAAQAELAVERVRGDSLARLAATQATVFRVDTLRLTKLLTTSETALVHLIDTAHVYHTDTVLVPVTVLVAADSTIKACRVTVSDCTAGWATEKALNADLRAELSATQRQPSKASKAIQAILWGLAGIEVGRLSATGKP